ncbi:MAG: AmmeMemoRadiSam system protein B [Chloroflexi bacterium HGW-Chloroflexi-1]|nr:MAG: AmmeMemoRadiSam system protein B [Chloroflexi bacterium HGW-Chloroflexi-1]
MSPSSKPNVRESAIAGTWYPGSAPALRRAVEGYLDQVTPITLPGRVLALISPHAGYAYSGPTAAHAYAQVRGAPIRRVVLLGPLHRPIWGSRPGAFMTPTEDAYRTPLGDVPVDHDFIAQLGARVTLTPVRGDEEHSLEIELPFLQVALDAFTLAPIMLGEQIGDPGAAARVDALAAALAELADEDTLFVASTDLSHLDNYADVVRIDRRLVDLVAAFDVDGLSAALRAGEVQACGATGLVAALKTAQKLGATGALVLAHTTSGDVTGDQRPGAYCVGYLAAAAYR